MDDIPDEVLLAVLRHLSEKDLARCCQVSWRWYAISSDCNLWVPLFASRFARLPDYERKNQGIIVKMQFMMEVECMKVEKLRQAIEEHQKRLDRWKNAHTPIELLPVLKYRKGELDEVSFITGKHMWGLLAWAFPVAVAYSMGARPALVVTVLGSLSRFYTYDSYYDEMKQQPKPNKDRLLSVLRCFVSGMAVCGGAALLGWASGAGAGASIDKSIKTVLGTV